MTGVQTCALPISESQDKKIYKMLESMDFDGKFSDAKIMREYLQGIARNTYYKYKKELVTELNV